MTPQTARNLTLCVPRPSFVHAQGGSYDAREPVLVESDIPTTDKADHILICVDRFGFSMNNITYQALGEAPHFRYFEYHTVPETPTTSQKSHGLIPAWGFGTVVWSSHKRVAAGERVYGYFAPTRYLLLPISPSDVSTYAVFVSRPHLPKDRRPYNMITRCSTDRLYDPDPALEDLMMLYRPLFWTAFWCVDWLAASAFRGGVTRFLVSSASSKTAFCFAYLIRRQFARDGDGDASRGLSIVGLTSTKHVGFTSGLGLYDRVLEYGALPALFESESASASREGERKGWIYADVAGNDALNERIRTSFCSERGARLVAQISLGLTNLSPGAPAGSSASWTANASLLDAAQRPAISGPASTTPAVEGAAAAATAAPDLPAPESFFMPEWLVLRRAQLSPAEIGEMQAAAWAALLRDGRAWVRVERLWGGEDGRTVACAYKEVVRGAVGPERGLVWSMWGEDGSGANVNANVNAGTGSGGKRGAKL
ncbi:hypothetical protein M0805_000382 [Coniferiporia weirii]|nr:hypothetical protein M0805_000382 [Coniferiporia weirii]